MDLSGGAVVAALLVVTFAFPEHADAAAAVAPSLNSVLSVAAQKAFKGGVAGLAAGAAQVLAFMWLRTAMNVQYSRGGTLQDALSSLWREGGIRRLYQGVELAIVQAPLARFGDTAANTGVLAVLAVTAPDVPLPLATAVASTAGACWRLLITPLDAVKTARQVRGADAVQLLAAKVQDRGPLALYDGAVAAAAASWVGNFPWFLTFNTLQAHIPAADGVLGLARNAAIGCAASAVSDTISNSLRVVKTIRQTASEDVSYAEAARQVIATDGVTGLLGRGLGTRLLVNVAQGAVFSVLIKTLTPL